MATLNNGVAYGFCYGLPPDENQNFIPRLFSINDVFDSTGNYIVDLSECINQNLIGKIQSVIYTVTPSGTGYYQFIHGITQIRFSLSNFNSGQDCKIIFPYLSPPDAHQHNLIGNAGHHFQLTFLNIPLPIVCNAGAVL
jgi:hypothetical protein